MTDEAVEPIAEREGPMADEPFAVTVHLVGPTWGVETGRKFTSATVLRRRRAKDKVLRDTGWVSTTTLADWRFGERNDIDKITREEAKWFAERLGVGQFIK